MIERIKSKCDMTHPMLKLLSSSAHLIKTTSSLGKAPAAPAELSLDGLIGPHVILKSFISRNDVLRLAMVSAVTLTIRPSSTIEDFAAIPLETFSAPLNTTKDAPVTAKVIRKKIFENIFDSRDTMENT